MGKTIYRDLLLHRYINQKIFGCKTGALKDDDDGISIIFERNINKIMLNWQNYRLIVDEFEENSFLVYK